MIIIHNNEHNNEHTNEHNNEHNTHSKLAFRRSSEGARELLYHNNFDKLMINVSYNDNNNNIDIII